MGDAEHPRDLLDGEPAEVAELDDPALPLVEHGELRERFVEIDGRRYSHLVDPATGLGLTHRLQVWVTAPSGIEADALASALSVLGPGRGHRLYKTHPGAEVIYRTERASRKPTKGPSTNHH